MARNNTINYAALVEDARNYHAELIDTAAYYYAPGTPEPTLELSLEAIADNFCDDANDLSHGALLNDLREENQLEEQARDDLQEAGNPEVLAQVLVESANRAGMDPDYRIDLARAAVLNVAPPEEYISHYRDVFDISRDGSDILITIDKWQLRWKFVDIADTTKPPFTQEPGEGGA